MAVVMANLYLLILLPVALYSFLDTDVTS